MSSDINSSIDALCSRLGEFISSKTVVGESVKVGDIVLIPLIDVSFGMGAGGGEKDKGKTGCAGGMGAKISPNAVIAIVNGHVQLINIKNQDALNKIIDLAPAIADKLRFNAAFSKAKKDIKDENNDENAK